MKKSIKSLVILSMLIITFSSCKENNTAKNSDNNGINSTEVISEKPATLEMKEDSLVIRVQQKAMEKVLKAKKKMASKVLLAVIKTQNSLMLLSDNKVDKAKKGLKEALSIIDAATAQYPDIKLLPINTDIKTIDLITDINSVKQITKEAEKALKNEHLQEARKLLTGLSSEIDITTVNIPLETYPKDIKEVLNLISQDKIAEAIFVLNNTVDGLVFESSMLPVPVLRAEVLIEEAMDRHLEDRTANKAIVINLLDNAAYQFKLAEVLGYGTNNNMYQELQKDIKSLKKSVNSDGDLKELFNKLKLKVSNFKEQII